MSGQNIRLIKISFYRKPNKKIYLFYQEKIELDKHARHARASDERFV